MSDEFSAANLESADWSICCEFDDAAILSARIAAAVFCWPFTCPLDDASLEDGTIGSLLSLRCMLAASSTIASASCN